MDDLFDGAAGRGAVYADRHLVVTRTEKPSGLRFAGEIDLSNSMAVGRSIKGAFSAGSRQHLDLSSLSFCDVSGIRALVDAAQEMGEGGCLLLHGLPVQLETVMRVTGWSRMPNLLLCSCGDVT